MCVRQQFAFLLDSLIRLKFGYDDLFRLFEKEGEKVTLTIARGNEALQEWLDQETMQNIGFENNLSETGFFVIDGDHYHIRWFTPMVEVPLCGHATLASAYVILNYLEPDLKKIHFHSKSGELIVTKEDDLISMNFPANKPKPVEPPPQILGAVTTPPKEILFNES